MDGLRRELLGSSPSGKMRGVIQVNRTPSGEYDGVGEDRRSTGEHAGTRHSHRAKHLPAGEWVNLSVSTFLEAAKVFARIPQASAPRMRAAGFFIVES